MSEGCVSELGGGMADGKSLCARMPSLMVWLRVEQVCSARIASQGRHTRISSNKGESNASESSSVDASESSSVVNTRERCSGAARGVSVFGEGFGCASTVRLSLRTRAVSVCGDFSRNNDLQHRSAVLPRG